MRDTLLAATMAPLLPRSDAVCADVVPSSCADAPHRHDGQVLFTGAKGAAGALDGRADGATLALHRYGKRAPRTRRGETRGASSPLSAVVHVFVLV